MRFSVLASGSSGNSLYVESHHSRVIVDAGLSCREILRRLLEIGIDPDTIDAVIVTHEHLDHIRGVGPLSRRLGVPVFINQATFRRGLRTLGDISRPVMIQTGEEFTLRDLSIETFTKCHDAADPMGLVLGCNGARMGLITDLGRSTKLVQTRLQGCRALVMEFNHDPYMLENGAYPLKVKRRIKGPDGHLSNQQAVELLRALAHEDLGMVVPAHLSAENNLPEMAVKAAGQALIGCGLSRSNVVVSSPGEPTPLFRL
ncbi:MAG: MBL fold metallo-hydrolase [Desulfobacteraceae bacterium]